MSTRKTRGLPARMEAVRRRFERWRRTRSGRSAIPILLKDKNASIGRLRKALFGASTEKTAAVVGSDVDSDAPQSSTENAAGSRCSSAGGNMPGRT